MEMKSILLVLGLALSLVADDTTLYSTTTSYSTTTLYSTKDNFKDEYYSDDGVIYNSVELKNGIRTATNFNSHGIAFSTRVNKDSGTALTKTVVTVSCLFGVRLSPSYDKISIEVDGIFNAIDFMWSKCRISKSSK